MAFGTPVFTTFTGAVGGGTTTSVDTSAITVTPLIVISVCWYDGIGANPTSSNVLDNKGNTFTAVVKYNSGSNCNKLFYCKNAATGTGHTFNYIEASSFSSLAVLIISGADTAAGADVESGSSSGGTSLTMPSRTPSENGELIVCGLCHSDTSAASISIDSSLTIGARVDGAPGSFEGNAIAWYVQPTAGAIAPAWSDSSSDLVVGAMATFKVAAGAAAIARRLMMLGVGS